MNKQSDQSVLWWVGWIALSILTFFAASYFWTGFISSHFGSMDQKGAPLLWVTAVFGTWMLLLVPLIVVMYNKVDRAYEDARIRREKLSEGTRREASGIKFISIPESERRLDARVVKKIKKMPWTIKRGNLVTAILKSGQRIDHVFVLDREQVVGVYGHEKLPFRVADIVDASEASEESWPKFETGKWLRLDG